MGGETLYSLILIGLGIDELSMNPSSILTIKKMIRAITLEEAKRIANHALTLKTSKEIEDYVKKEIKNKFHNKFIFN